jgi:hypothetical protein
MRFRLESIVRARRGLVKRLRHRPGQRLLPLARTQEAEPRSGFGLNELLGLVETIQLVEIEQPVTDNRLGEQV